MTEQLQHFDWFDILERALWTFVQGAIGSVTVIPLVADVSQWRAIGIAALTGGISAVLSFAKTVIKQHVEREP